MIIEKASSQSHFAGADGTFVDWVYGDLRTRHLDWNRDERTEDTTIGTTLSELCVKAKYLPACLAWR